MVITLTPCLQVFLGIRFLALALCWSSPQGVLRPLRINPGLWQGPLSGPLASPSPSEIPTKGKSVHGTCLLRTLPWLPIVHRIKLELLNRARTAQLTFPVLFSTCSYFILNSRDTQLPSVTRGSCPPWLCSQHAPLARNLGNLLYPGPYF